jgi:hypothetical protein
VRVRHCEELLRRGNPALLAALDCFARARNDAERLAENSQANGSEPLFSAAGMTATTGMTTTTTAGVTDTNTAATNTATTTSTAAAKSAAASATAITTTDITATDITAVAIIGAVVIAAVVAVAADHPAQHAGNHSADQRLGNEVATMTIPMPIPDLLDLQMGLYQFRTGYAGETGPGGRRYEYQSRADDCGNSNAVHLMFPLLQSSMPRAGFRPRHSSHDSAAPC